MNLVVIASRVLLPACSDAPSFVLRPKVLYQHQPDQSVTLPCVAEGDPTPVVDWRKVRLYNAIKTVLPWLRIDVIGGLLTPPLWPP